MSDILIPKVKVTVESGASMTANIETGNHRFVLDETVDASERTDPYDLILSALGACVAITVQLYANRKQWPLERVEVSLYHERIHADDCEQCESPGARLTQLTKRIKFSGNLTEAQIQRLKVISSRCPVQKTLEAGIRVKTILLE